MKSEPEVVKCPDCNSDYVTFLRMYGYLWCHKCGNVWNEEAREVRKKKCTNGRKD